MSAAALTEACATLSVLLGYVTTPDVDLDFKGAQVQLVPCSSITQFVTYFFPKTEKEKFDAVAQQLRETISRLGIKSLDNLDHQGKVLLQKVNRLFDVHRPGEKPPLDFLPKRRLAFSKVPFYDKGVEAVIKRGWFSNYFLNTDIESYFSHFKDAIVHLFPGTFTGKPFDVDEVFSREDLYLRPEAEEYVRWWGHASVEIAIGDIMIFCDPVMGTNFITPCFKRHTPKIDVSQLPVPDVVLISHNHKDHRDKKTLSQIRPFSPMVLTPIGMQKWFENIGFSKITEHNWWEQTVITGGKEEVKITAIPARHWSQDGVFDGNTSLWSGYMIESHGKKVYFAGDTGLDKKMFREIREKFGKIDIALLPIAPKGEPVVHMDEEEALTALEILEADRMIPIHWGVFRTCDEQILDPKHWLEEALDKRAHLKGKVSILKIGESLAIEERR